MFIVHVYASPFAITLLLISLSVWLCICRWGFGYNLKDQEVIPAFLRVSRFPYNYTPILTRLVEEVSSNYIPVVSSF